MPTGRPQPDGTVVEPTPQADEPRRRTGRHERRASRRSPGCDPAQQTARDDPAQSGRVANA